jgi:hypothetical protein
MKTRHAIALTLLAAAFVAGNASAQRTKVAPAPVFYDDAVEVTLPADNTFQIRIDGLKSLRAVWMSFTGYAGGKPPRDPQVIMLMEGVTAKWGAPDGGCTYEFKIADGAAPVINMKKASSICTLRDGEKANFRVLAM